MATIRKRGRSFQVQIRLPNLPLKSASFTTKKEAQVWAAATEKAMRQLTPLVGKLVAGDTTLRNLILRYRDTVAIHKRSYERSLRPILTAFARDEICDKALSRLTLQDFIGYRDRQLKRLKPYSLKTYLSHVRKVLTHANDEWELNVTNFVAKLKFKAKLPPRNRRISQAEKRAIYDTILKWPSLDKNQRDLVADFFVFGLETGMRRSEICRVESAHYSASEGTLFIPVTKTEEPRTIGLSPIACKILDKRHDLAFCFPVKIRAFESMFRRIVVKAGVENFRFHDTRRECISNLYDLGLTTPEVAQQSGHKDYRVLAHYSNAKIRNIVSKLKENGNGKNSTRRQTSAGL